jgi:predicted Zn-dependent protease
MKNSIKLIMLAISALLFMGCAEPGELSIDQTTQGQTANEIELAETAGTNHFQAIGFTESEVKIIQKAADMWLPGFITVDTNVVEGGSKFMLGELETLGRADYFVSRTEITIENSWPNNRAEWEYRLFKVGMHEFGHHFGFRYNEKTRGHIEAGNVMCEVFEGMVNAPTEADLKYAGLM